MVFNQQILHSYHEHSLSLSLMSLIFAMHVVYGPNVETNLYMNFIVCLTSVTPQ